MNGWLGGWTDRQTDGWMDKWMDKCMNAGIQGQAALTRRGQSPARRRAAEAAAEAATADHGLTDRHIHFP
jgi:hypothetical protein